MYAEVVTNVGLVRKNNEDAAWSDIEKQLFIVADGMGGYVAGEVASVMAIESVRQSVTLEQKDPPPEVLRQAFYQANDSIYSEAKKHQEFTGMGTTLSALWIVDGRAYISHVGDSRIHLIRAGEITRLTQDHSLVGELVREGGLTEEEAMAHPQKNVLTRALGCNSLVEVDMYDLEIKDDDYFLLCTDGLSNLITSEEMAKISTSQKDLKKAANQLLELALERGGFDNMTAIIVHNK